jgi:hypothetical protein
LKVPSILSKQKYLNANKKQEFYVKTTLSLMAMASHLGVVERYDPSVHSS